MKSSSQQIPCEIPALQELVDEIVEAEGVITPDQERKWSAIIEASEGAIDAALRITELKNWCATSKRWRDNRREMERHREHAIGKLQALMVGAFHVNGVPRPEQKVKPIKDPARDVTLSYVRRSQGTLDVNDPELSSPHTVKGYTREEVEKSALPTECFEVQEVFVLKKDELVSQLELGLETATARIIPPEPSVRISAKSYKVD